MKYIIKTMLLTILLLTQTCKDNPVDPLIEPGRRDYTWTVDTLNIPFTILHRIWGSAPDDVWAVGPGGDLDKTIYHFNGTEWENDGVSRGISPRSVWGFGENNVWLGGGDGKIWHYNGINWSESVRFEKNNNIRIVFQEMWGDAPNNLFAAGLSDQRTEKIAVIAHYNGTKWELTEFSNFNYSFLRMKRGIKESSNYFIEGIKDETTGSETVGLFEYDGKDSIKQIYEAQFDSQNWAFPQEIDGKMFFVIGTSINKFIDSQFKLFAQINEPNFGLQIFGRSGKDIFLRMEDGIAHYNGNSLEYLYRFENMISIADAVVFEREVFFLTTDYDKGLNLIIKGKLN